MLVMQFCLWLVIPFLGVLEKAEAPPRLPNVVLILTDDQGWGDLSLHGNTTLKTPHLDKLAQDGIRMNYFYVSPLCAPTRASLLTGRYHLRTGTVSVSGGKERMHSEEVTLAEVFKSNGYRTGIFGKWHNGEHFPEDPTGQGFDEFVGFCAGHWNNYFDTQLQHNQDKIKTKGYITDVLTDHALRFIEKNSNQPFFCYVPYNAPHSPFQVSDKYFDKYKALGLNDKDACVYGMVENVDDNVGRILHKLESPGLEENTIVIFLSDNGPNGERFNGDMKGIKGSVDEGGHRVPFFIRWKGRIPKGKIIETNAAHIDLLPSLIGLCSLNYTPIKPLDGINLTDLWLGKVLDLSERELFTHVTGHQFAGLPSFNGAVRTKQYRLTVKKEGIELYDLQKDYSQIRNIAAEQPQTAKSLKDAYEKWLKETSKESEVIRPIPIANRRTELQAPEAQFAGNIRYKQGNGWANDWFVGAQAPADSIWWNLEVEDPGMYEVFIEYASTQRVGNIRIDIQGKTLLKKLPKTNADLIPSPDRVTRQEVYEREWKKASVGKVILTKGQCHLKLVPDSGNFEIKAITFLKRS